MAVKSIISRPVYGTLSPQPGSDHLLIADAEGAAAILDLAKAAPADFFAEAEIVYIPRDDGRQIHRRAEGAEAGALVRGPVDRRRPAAPEADARHRAHGAAALSRRHRGADRPGHAGGARGRHRPQLDPDRAARLAGAARAVRALQGHHRGRHHAAGACSHCGLLLLVRDHYSRRIAAFQGVCINAEDQSEVPPMEEMFK